MKPLRKVLLALLVLAYAAQSLASVSLSCPQMAAGGGMDMADHAGHDMSSGAVDAPESSCCDGGLCAMAQCHPAPALPSALSSHSQHHTATYPCASATSAPLKPSYTLFKPPILS